MVTIEAVLRKHLREILNFLHFHRFYLPACPYGAADVR